MLLSLTMSGSRAGRVARRVPGAVSSMTVMWACGRWNCGGLSFTSRSFTETQAVSVWRLSSHPPRPWGRQGTQAALLCVVRFIRKIIA